MLTTNLTELLQEAFTQAGYDKSYAVVVKSQRPELCQFQCNGCMSASKQYKKPPFVLAEEVVARLKGLEGADAILQSAEVAKPGFINLTLQDSFLASAMDHLRTDGRAGVGLAPSPYTIVLDYGGPNIAKPLHVGHLRTAIIGESIKRLSRFLGHEVIGDIHLGDWGLQMGMVISEIRRRQPDLPYFDENYSGAYPSEPPFTLEDLEEIYPMVSKLAKEDEAVNAAAKEATFDLQNGRRGYVALWKHIVDLSLGDIRKNYARLGVDFDLWYGESTSNAYVEDVIEILQEQNALYESQGAMVVDVGRPDDKKEIPPIIIYKSDGSILYGTTDLATLYQRAKDFDPDYVLYVVDSRQANHFLQVFRCATDHGIVAEHTKLEHIGFGTMNGKDGKPFKTREGGVLRLSDLIDMVENNAREKILDKEGLDVEEVTHKVGLATLKFADLSNYRMKDYIFDLDKFSSFEGKTGPYILYTNVRINNILSKLEGTVPGPILPAASEVERQIFLKVGELPHALETAFIERAPSVVCEYVYELSTLLNGFYHAHHILNEKDLERKQSWVSLLLLAKKVSGICLDILGLEVPERM
ncbi:arginine--tRNA ligase [Anaerotalea alkaliphila]|uniref:Arginine--tRNA ligase n=1 Tax=Anaerotalea alkaliphila TaxID=2662126 RepID=A0A7X5HW55_9FIRM|nr:arginine--tRNA ligase [Anaerotalea alkaliphila]NDL67755.1 arginine--tRNA ligase [Anaerotalea alkaliphila]